jgi:heme-degrading monooxygenase HmoA
MTFAAINVIQVTADKADTLEERFSARKGAVDQSPGFQSFELLRPLAGQEDYLVITRWDSEDDFTAWQSSESFGRGHQADPTGQGKQRPVASSATLWTFDVVQSAG